MNQFRKYMYLLLLMISGIGLFFGDVSLSPVPSSDGALVAEYHFTASEVFAAGGATKTDPAKTPPGDNNWTETANNVISGINFLLAAVTALASVAVGSVSWLLSPDWTSGDLFNLRESLYQLWITVSNIIYFIYAIALIVVAVMTMFNNKNFGYKELLPRLVVGILMVPFTWWAVQFAVSLSTVLTASVLSIPMETINQSGAKNSWWETESIPTCIATGGPDNKKEIEQCNEKTAKISPKDFSKNVGGIYGNLVIYAYGVFRMHEVDEIDTFIDKVSTAAQIINNGIIGVIMFLIFGIMMIALVFVLVLRVFKLWAYAIFSPLFTFGYVFKNSTKGLDDEETFSVREFIGLVFLPAIIGLILSFGLILINALNSTSAKVKENPCNKTQIKSPEGCKIASIMGNPKNTITRKVEESSKGEKIAVTTFTYGGIDMKWYGGSMQGQDEQDVNDAIGIFSTVGGAFGVIFLNLIAIIFVWISFVAAKNVSKTAQKIIDPVQSAGKSLASAAKSAPMHSIKVPGFGNIAGVTKAAGGLEMYLRGKSQKEWQGSKMYEMLNKNNPISKEEGEVLSQSSNTLHKDNTAVGNYGTINFNLKNASGANAISYVEQRDSGFFGKMQDIIKKTSDSQLDKTFGSTIGTKFKNYIKGIKGPLKDEDKITILAYLKGWDGGVSGLDAKTYIATGHHDNLKGVKVPEKGSETPKKEDPKKEKEKKEEEKKDGTDTGTPTPTPKG